jgi:hypothetical protein
MKVGTPEAPVMVAIDPRTGCHLREATPEEIAAWENQPVRPVSHPAFRFTFHKAIKVGDVLVDRDTGPGAWHGGAGF